MKALSVALVLALSLPAFAEGEPESIPSDVPMLAEVVSGEATIASKGEERKVLLPKGAFINEAGMLKLSANFISTQEEVISLTAQNESLKKKVDEIAAEPTLNVKAVVLIAAGALVTGAALGAGAVFLLKK